MTTFNTAKSLADLLAALQSAYREMDTDDWKNLDLGDLPTFGGTPPPDTSACWSWDAGYLLIGDGSVTDWQIVARDEETP